jgi:hypothetical protein
LTGPRLAIDHADPAEAVPPRLECHPLTMDESLALRPVREDDLAMFDSLVLDPAIIGEFGWFGWFDLRRWRRGWEENQLLGPTGRRPASPVKAYSVVSAGVMAPGATPSPTACCAPIRRSS